MTRHFVLATSTALATALAPTLTLADVTAADVWANQLAQYKAMGAVVEAELSTSGNVTTVSDMTATWAIPIVGGTITAKVTMIELVENGDATVTMRYPGRSDMLFAIDVPGQVAGSIPVRLTTDYELSVSGDPGSVTYSYDTDEIGIAFSGMQVSGPLIEQQDLQFLADSQIDGSFVVAGSRGSYKITEGDLLTIDWNDEYASMSYGVTFSGGEISGGENGGDDGGTTMARFAMPADGTSIFAIPDALRAGLSIVAASDIAGSRSQSEFFVGDERVSFSKDRIARMDVSMSFDASGLKITGVGEDFEVQSQEPDLPILIELAGDIASGTLDIPLMGADQPQDFTYNFALEGLKVAESLWQLFDPAGALPRDPATLRLASSGQIGTTMDLFDFAAWMGIDNADPFPFSIHETTISELYLSAVGAELSGKGGFTFDMTDLATFDGIPAPTGEMDFTINGSNALIDKLVDLGMIQAEEAMGARMGMGLFARPGDGPDSLVSKIEIVGSSGAILANGQRIR